MILHDIPIDVDKLYTLVGHVTLTTHVDAIAARVILDARDAEVLGDKAAKFRAVRYWIANTVALGLNTKRKQMAMDNIEALLEVQQSLTSIINDLREDAE